jgi:hypothetical protein
MAISPETKSCGTGDLQACTYSLGMAAPRRQKIVGKPNAAVDACLWFCILSIAARQ